MTAGSTSGAATFRVLLRIETHPGAAPEFEQTWLRVGDSVTEHPANRGQWLLRSNDETDVYYIVSDWSDEPGFRHFEHTERHVQHRVQLHPYRAGGSMTTMNLVHYVPPSAVAAS